MATVHPRAIRPARPGFDVTVHVPGSKSVTNRALLLAGLGDGESVLEDALVADDTLAFAEGLRSLGIEVAGMTAEGAAGRVRIRGAAGRIPAREARVWCAEAGTAARFLTAACAAGQGRYAFDGAGQLRPHRPAPRPCPLTSSPPASPAARSASPATSPASSSRPSSSRDLWHVPRSPSSSRVS